VGEALSKIVYGLDFAIKPGAPRAAWYAVQTLYRHEQRIAHDLAVKGFATYLPLIRETRQWTDRKKVIEVPAFGGYIFVRHDASLSNRVRVLETAGVLRMLGDNHAPVPVPDTEIESLRRMLESNMACNRCDFLPVGTMVQVKSGVLAGIRGRLSRINSSLRLVLSDSTVSQGISVEVDLEDVEPIAKVPGQQSSPRDLEAALLGA
jgi:transcription antitermination factor NusG